ncbi:phosphoribosylanthranilate isomerase [Desulfosoma caldarium]|uniref:N-(5'-phosphoribosyl)anthranilate isomerase n=1 Tax=Desulfosoma caldarium TaxID=610254 RepID=A0A3N1UR58_9BACT|nr:phosphoribosylanthranilate isomerase [Desulfosoma caldarium]ROQ93595.1 phosphoribosylanthranilate isomerase [Desulfosoma caldarium]
MDIKICGITCLDDARAASALDIQAVGLVFYPKSPRFVDDATARSIARALSSHIAAVGVFVDVPWEAVLARARSVGLHAVQLHGHESPEDVARLQDAGLRVIKALFINRAPLVEAHVRYAPSAFLVECAGAQRPGGNALAWDWRQARGAVKGAPMILAGGLSPENVEDAVRAAEPSGVDVSSGVESRPGRKDPEKMNRFVNAVRRLRPRLLQGGIFS